MTIPQKRMSRGGPIRSVNVERHQKEWGRAFHSLERVKLVQSLRCIACGRRPSSNCHTENDGKGRKGDYTVIVPCCRTHHNELDNTNGRAAFEAKYNLSLERCAAETETAWKAYAAREGLTP